MGLPERVVSRFLRAPPRPILARDVRLDAEMIEGLRKDFLTLMRNLPRIKSYKDGSKLRDAFRTFRANFDALFFETFLNRDFKYDTDFPDSDRSYYDRRLRKSGWDFSIELRLPLDYPNEHYSEEARLAAFEQEKDKWANRIKVKARAFWNEMDQFFGYMSNRKGQPSYTVKTRDVDQIEMEGFHVRVVGYDDEGEGRDYISDFFARFKEGLKVFRRRASQVFPDMLRHMLPIQVNAYATLDEGGMYRGDHIEIALTGFMEEKNPNIVAHVLAHEMGHHLFKNYLSEGDQKFWYEAIRNDATELDVERLLKVWPEGAWAHELVEKLKDTDPLIALQIDVIAHGYSLSGGPKFEKREEFEKLLSEGFKFITVKHPITGYAGKNAEEAFCETLGRLVGYGPATVAPVVRHWLSLILPGVRVASKLAKSV